MGKKRNEFKLFSIKHKWLYVILLIIPLLIVFAIAVYAWCEQATLDLSVWSSICIGLLTYLGSTFLGIIVYYNSWVQQFRKERLDYGLDNICFLNGKAYNYIPEDNLPAKQKIYHHFLAYSEYEIDNSDYSYIILDVTNYNQIMPISLKIFKVELVFGKEKVDCTEGCRLFTNFKINEPIDYKKKNRIFVGINEKVLSRIYEKNDVEFYTSTKTVVYMQVYNKVGYCDWIKAEVTPGFYFDYQSINKDVFLKNVESQVYINSTL